MDPSEYKKVGNALANALNGMCTARLTTESLRDALANQSKLPENILQLIAGCLGTHDTAVTLTEGFVNLLGAPELSILNSAGANIRARVQLARQLAGPLEQIALAPPAAAAPAPPAPAAAAPAPAAPAAAPAPAPLVAPDPLPGMRKIVEAVLVADKDAEGGLRDARAAFETLKVLHPDYEKNVSKGLWGGFSEKAENYLAGTVVTLACGLITWWMIHTINRNPALQDMSRLESARGLLTLLVVGTTVFVGMLIVLGMWLGDGDAESETKFLRSKEVFAILMTASGTILGFYYGSEKSAAPLAPQLQITPAVALRAPDQPRLATMTASISGGKPPYYFSVQSTNDSVKLPNSPATGGAILHTFTNVSVNQAVPFTIVVTDAATNKVSANGEIDAK